MENQILCPNCNIINNNSNIVCTHCGFNLQNNNNNTNIPIQSDNNNNENLNGNLDGNLNENLNENNTDDLMNNINEIIELFNSSSITSKASVINYLVILLFVFIFVTEHIKGVLLFFYSYYILSNTNDVIKKQYSLRDKKLMHSFMGLFLFLFIHLFIYLYYFAPTNYDGFIKIITQVRVKDISYSFYSVCYRTYFIDSLIVYLEMIFIKCSIAFINYNKDNSHQFYYNRVLLFILDKIFINY